MSEACTAASAIHAATRDADSETAHLPTHAPHAATYAIKALFSTGYSVTDNSADEEQRWQYRHLPKHLGFVVFPDEGVT